MFSRFLSSERSIYDEKLAFFPFLHLVIISSSLNKYTFEIQYMHICPGGGDYLKTILKKIIKLIILKTILKVG